ncbi:MAG: SpoIIIAH-like family protein [Acetatifactor sp.]|nr:SpoIIIAH-like family protein [Acetatifactor sp.]
MKNLIKKNQLMITALAIMLAIAGYLQFAGTNLDEKYLVDDDKTAEAANTEGVITDNMVAGQYSVNDIDGLLDLSEADLTAMNTVEIDSLDSDEDVITENYLDADMVVGEVQPGEGEVPGEAVFSSSNGVAMLSEAKLLKEQIRAKNKETLLEIINSDGLSEEQKQEAVNTMVQMTAIAEKEAAAEILLEAKGFSDVVVSINDGAVDVVVNALTLTDVQRAQIEDIVKRKTEISAENIIISTVVQE